MINGNGEGDQGFFVIYKGDRALWFGLTMGLVLATSLIRSWLAISGGVSSAEALGFWHWAFAQNCIGGGAVGWFVVWIRRFIRMATKQVDIVAEFVDALPWHWIQTKKMKERIREKERIRDEARAEGRAEALAEMGVDDVAAYEAARIRGVDFNQAIMNGVREGVAKGVAEAMADAIAASLAESADARGAARSVAESEDEGAAR